MYCHHRSFANAMVNSHPPNQRKAARLPHEHCVFPRSFLLSGYPRLYIPSNAKTKRSQVSCRTFAQRSLLLRTKIVWRHTRRTRWCPVFGGTSQRYVSPRFFRFLSVLVMGDSEDDAQQPGEDDGCYGPTDPAKVELDRWWLVRTG